MRWLLKSDKIRQNYKVISMVLMTMHAEGGYL